MHYIGSRKGASLVIGLWVLLVAAAAPVSHATEVAQSSATVTKRKVSTDDIKVLNLLLFEAKKNNKANEPGYAKRNLEEVENFIQDLEKAGVTNLSSFKKAVETVRKEGLEAQAKYHAKQAKKYADGDGSYSGIENEIGWAKENLQKLGKKVPTQYFENLRTLNSQRFTEYKLKEASARTTLKSADQELWFGRQHFDRLTEDEQKSFDERAEAVRAQVAKKEIASIVQSSMEFASDPSNAGSAEYLVGNIRSIWELSKLTREEVEETSTIGQTAIDTWVEPLISKIKSHTKNCCFLDAYRLMKYTKDLSIDGVKPSEKQLKRIERMRNNLDHKLSRPMFVTKGKRTAGK